MKKESVIYSKVNMVLITFLSIAINVFIFLIPVLVNKIINMEILFFEFTILAVILAMLIQIIFQMLLVVIQNQYMKKYKVKTCINLYQKIFSMSYETIVNSGSTYLIQRADAAALTFAQLDINVIPTIISKSLVIIIILLYSLSVNVLLFCIMVGMTITNILGFYFLNNILSKKSIYMQENIPKEREDIYQIGAQVDFLKQNEDNTTINPILNRHLEKIEQINTDVNIFANGGSNVINFFNMFLQNLILIVLSYLLLNEKNGIDDIFTVSLLMTYFVPAVMSIVSANLNIRELKASKDFVKFLDDNKERNGTISIDGIREIEIDAEKIGINGGPTVLNNVKLKVKRGDIVGIIGESGTGKSTLMKVILKYWNCAEIKINGIPLERIKNESYRQYISYYPQNPLIITGNIEENLNFGRKETCDVFETMFFLKKFQDANLQWNKEIVENGNNMSGGDRQKISLARLLVDTAEVIILDEPTSSLDKETEERILDTFFENSRGKIIFIITHRIENLKYCNKIYRIENCKLEEICAK